MASSLAMLLVLWRDNQWKDRIIRWQQIVNELTLYLLCLQLFMFTDIFNTFHYTHHHYNGTVFVAIVLASMLFNLLVIIKFTISYIYALRTRRNNILETQCIRIQTPQLKLYEQEEKLKVFTQSWSRSRHKARMREAIENEAGFYFV